jgi:hypothetical protein
MADGRERVVVIACGALAREIAALIRANGLRHISLRCLPATLHNRPDRIPTAVAEVVADAQAEGAQVFVAYADCGTGGALDRMLAEAGVDRLPGPHCYALYSGVERFAARAEADMRCFYLTDFLARQFETLVIKPLGLDRHPELRDAYFGQYETLVYLAQADDPSLRAKAQRAAERLGLACEVRLVGYGDLARSVTAL